MQSEQKFPIVINSKSNSSELKLYYLRLIPLFNHNENYPTSKQHKFHSVWLLKIQISCTSEQYEYRNSRVGMKEYSLVKWYRFTSVFIFIPCSEYKCCRCNCTVRKTQVPFSMSAMTIGKMEHMHSGFPKH